MGNMISMSYLWVKHHLFSIRQFFRKVPFTAKDEHLKVPWNSIHKIQKDVPAPTVFERLSYKEHRLLRLVETFVYDISMMPPKNTPIGAVL